MTQRTLPAPGLCHVTTNGKMVVYEAESGSLCVAIPCELLESEVAWAGKYTATLVKSDGTVQRRTVETLKAIFGWDGLDPFALEEIEPGTVNFEGTGEHSQYTPEGETEPVATYKLQWINPPGGSAKMPEPISDRKSVLAKYGSKFKALAGSGATSKTTTTKAAATATKQTQAELPGTPQPTKKAAAGGPPGRRGAAPAKAPRSMTCEEVWDAYVKANPTAAEDQKLQDKFYEAQDAVRPGANSEMTNEEWGQVADNLGL